MESKHIGPKIMETKREAVPDHGGAHLTATRVDACVPTSRVEEKKKAVSCGDWRCCSPAHLAAWAAGAPIPRLSQPQPLAPHVPSYELPCQRTRAT
jgi:hypothetical protein